MNSASRSKSCSRAECPIDLQVISAPADPAKLEELAELCGEA